MDVLRFENPGMLHLLWGVVLWILFFVWVVRYKQFLLKRFGNPEILQKLIVGYSTGRRNLKYMLIILSYIFFVIALANPQIGKKLEEFTRRGVDIMVALDVSASMMAEDIQPNRLEKAKHEVGQLIDLLQGDRIGLIAFAGIAHVQCPLTLDYSAAKLFLSIMDTDLIPQPGTGIGEAIAKAIPAFNTEDRKYKVLILITDGEDHQSDPVEFSKEAEKEGIIIYTVGIGSPQGVPIPVYNRSGNKVGFKKDREGNIVTTKLDVMTLQKIAYQTGGKYYLASSGGAELDAIYDEIAAMEEKDLVSKRFSQYEDRFQVFLLLGLISIVIEILIPERRRVKKEWLGRFV
ncbi:MAG: VWA domain-containing protein [Calditrichales bacterium]|nr:MAG: VWA domain-containing protein [Calditrichales bacterium]